MGYLAPYQRKLSEVTRYNQATAKLYIVRFTCLSTRALHLEIAGDLSTDPFILSLRRFLAKRGTVKVIRSDNGTKFVGASTVMKRSIKALDPAKSAESLATFICEVESIINQRPIVPVRDDLTDFGALTPNHFTIGSDCFNFSPGVFVKQEINLCRKWRAVQATAKPFWNRWK